MNRDPARHRNRPKTLHAAAFIVLILAVATPSWSDEARNRCVSADVPGQVLLPDGTSHPAGSIQICLRHNWTPVVGLHEIRIDGHSVGLFRSRVVETDEYGKRDPLILFHDNGPGAYKLIGYAWPNGKTAKAFRLQPFGRQKSKEQLMAKATDPSRPRAVGTPQGEAEEIVFLAARATP